VPRGVTRMGRKWARAALRHETSSPAPCDLLALGLAPAVSPGGHAFGASHAPDCGGGKPQRNEVESCVLGPPCKRAWRAGDKWGRPRGASLGRWGLVLNAQATQARAQSVRVSDHPSLTPTGGSGRGDLIGRHSSGHGQREKHAADRGGICAAALRTRAGTAHLPRGRGARGQAAGHSRRATAGPHRRNRRHIL